MTTASRDNTKRRRPDQTGQLIGVRLQPDHLAVLDRWIAEQPEPMSRPEAMRRLLSEGAAAPHLREALRLRDSLQDVLERDLAREVAPEHRETLAEVIAGHRAKLKEFDEGIAALIEGGADLRRETAD